MELNFGKNIKQLRKSRDLTQEVVADAIGVSAQSVSKWECGYGYPDITQLPTIANYFGVTIDELLNNDRDSRKTEYNKFYETVNKCEYGSEEQIEIMCEYCRRYPNDLEYCLYLSNVLSCNIARNSGNRAKYYPLLKKTVEKMLEDPEYRNMALCNIIVACGEDELENYLGMSTYNVEYTRRNMLINRYVWHEDVNNHIIHQGLAFIENMVEHLDMRYPDELGPENKAEYHKCILSLIRSFSENGNVPDGWLAFYAYKQLVFAACLFGSGNKEKGKEEFISAIEKFKRFHALTDDFLDMGGIIFGNLKMNKQWSMTLDTNGEKHELYDTGKNGMFSNPNYILSLLTNPRWAWFNSERNEHYYKDAVKWLEGLVNENALEIPNEN